jgi:hypothetical protein
MPIRAIREATPSLALREGAEGANPVIERNKIVQFSIEQARRPGIFQNQLKRLRIALKMALTRERTLQG